MEKKTKNIWKEIEIEKGNSNGIKYRLFSPESDALIYLGILGGNSQKCLLIPHVEINQETLSNFPKFEHINITFVEFTQPLTTSAICVILETDTLIDLFSFLCEDLIERIEAKPNEYLKILGERLILWKKLFEAQSPTGLSLEDQRGLWGEIRFISDLLEKGMAAQDAINSWKGPKGMPKDFSTQLSDIEIKTSIQSNHPKITINGAEQLTKNQDKNLFLVCYQIQESQLGTSLLEIINNLQSSLEGTPTALLEFNETLFLTGFFNCALEEYNIPKYSLKETKFFNVIEGFPRLSIDTVPEGIGDLRYTITLSSLSNFRTTLNDIYELI